MPEETPSRTPSYRAIFEPALYVPRAFAGNDRQPCPVQYTLLAIQDDSTFEKIAIAIFQDIGRFPGATSYVFNDEERNLLINQILREAAPGVAIEFVRVIFLSVTKEGIGVADELKLSYDPGTLENHGVPVQKKGMLSKEKSWLSRDVVVGSIPFYTDYDNRRPLPDEEIVDLLAALGREEKRVKL